MSPNVAVIAGASGLVGRYLTRVLLEDAFFDRVTLLVRRNLPLDHPKLEQRLVDFGDLIPEELKGATHLFCALGTTIRKAGSKEVFRQVDRDYPLAFARAGRRAGAVRMAIVSSVGADDKSGNFYLKTKGETEAGLRTVGFQALHIFRPSLLMGARDESRTGEAVGTAFARAFEWLMVGGLRKYRAIPAAVVAQAMSVAAEREPDGTRVYEYDGIRRLAV